MVVQKQTNICTKWGIKCKKIGEKGGQIPKIVEFNTNIGSVSGSNYMQWYPGPKVKYGKANRGHKQSWLYKNRPI